ncbi:hypothetical protein H9P43_004970 [Blastocladiella emersonii ATCC 22665]|nr:hypothetical protein H9P43_004970 [Blastocladiella emersonii ATCC 22665]
MNVNLTRRGSPPKRDYVAVDAKFSSGSDSDAPSRRRAGKRSTRRVAITSAVVATAVTAALLIGIGHLLPSRGSDNHPDTLPLSGHGALLTPAELESGLAQCRTHASVLDREYAPRAKRINQRDASQGVATLIRKATVWDGLGAIHPDTDVLLVDGLIHAVGVNLDVPEGAATVVEAEGRILTPGIVDMHSHAGTDNYPSLDGTSDTNEFGNPTLPMMRTIDTFHPHDKALPLILSGGVTTIMVLPGSANLMGGEAFAFKTPQPATNSAEDMLLFSNITRGSDAEYTAGGPLWRWSKQACGENPKRSYGGGEGVLPFTRMGNAFLVRQKYEEATKLRHDQDEWCRIADHMAEANKHKKKKHPKDGKGSALIHPKGRYPSPIAHDQLVSLLRGNVRLNWHCYEINDLETQMRVAREFNVSIAAFHHALDIGQITPALKRWNDEGRTPIGAAIFSDHWSYKKEAYQASVYTAQVLENAGVPFAFKSDHPVLHSQYLVHESARAIQYGLSEQSTLKALTSTPAKLMGVDYRVGSIEVGKDADVVLWPTNPFHVGSLPDLVIVDGAVAFTKTAADPQPIVPEPTTPVPARVAVADKAKPVFITNVGKIVTGAETVAGPTHLRVVDGKITCIGAACGSVPAPEGQVTIDLQGGTITPSLVAAGTVLGTVEIAQEPTTHDGTAKTGTDGTLVYTRDGLQAGGLLELVSASQGVGLAISVADVKGAPALAVSTLFATNYTTPHVLRDVVAVHTPLGAAAKSAGGLAGSVSGQIAALRHWLAGKLSASAATDEDTAVLRQVREGRVPLVLHTESANAMASALRLKRAVDPANAQRWVIAGAAESHLVVDELAAFNGTVGVLLSPARCIPAKWDARRCLSPPNTYRGAVHAAALLKRARVPFAISSHPSELSSVRNLRFDAGWVRRLADLSEEEMVRAVTSDVFKLFGLSPSAPASAASVEAALTVGGVARFNAWNGNFGELTTQLLFAVDGDSEAVVNYPVHL